jgi:hypothetical protein
MGVVGNQSRMRAGVQFLAVLSNYRRILPGVLVESGIGEERGALLGDELSERRGLHEEKLSDMPPWFVADALDWPAPRRGVKPHFGLLGKPRRTLSVKASRASCRGVSKH